jgi:DNA-binding transcriptional LysR family regulator
MYTFTTTVEKKSFIKAAKALNVSAAAVSKQIKLLEKELQVELIQRSTKSFKLTAVGEIYYEQSKDILAKVELAEETMLAYTSQIKGGLHIVCHRYFGNCYIIPYLAKFMRLYPEIKVSLELAERIPDFQAEKVDLLLGISLPPPLGTIQKKLFSTKYVLCASPVYLKKYGTPKTLEELQKHRYMTHLCRDERNKMILDGGQVLTIEPLLFANDTESLRELCLQGLGIIKIHEYMVREAIDKNLLIPIMPQYTQDQLSIFLCYPESRFKKPAIRCFIDFLMKHINS